MGVFGLKTFMEKENRRQTVNIIDEINKWKNENPDQKPIIAVDFSSVSHWALAQNPKDIICGGRHKVAADRWQKFLKGITDAGATMAFFADLKNEETKNLARISRKEEAFDDFVKIYDGISNGATLDDIVMTNKSPRALKWFDTLEKIATEFGEFHACVYNDCDFECAQYATKNNVLAVMSLDTDFLIFKGSWKLWMPDHGNRANSDQFEINEYDRNAIKVILSLEEQQWPLFASLAGNDFTKEPIAIAKPQIEVAARLARKINSGLPTEAELRRIVADFRHDDATKVMKIIMGSIKSYDLNVPSVMDNDPFINEISKTDMFRTFMSTMENISAIDLNYYDLRGCEQAEYLPILFINWKKRCVGVIREQFNANPIVLTFLAKKHFDEKFKAYKEEPELPDFLVPTLTELYLYEDDVEIIKIKWKILAFIMALSYDEILEIKRLPKKFLLISTTLFILVKNGLLTKKQADGILYTTYKVVENETGNVKYPVRLVAEHVRAAHIYNISFKPVKKNFEISGLGSLIENGLEFDGVYFQTLMEEFDKMDMEGDKYVKFTQPIQLHRIYKNI